MIAQSVGERLAGKGFRVLFIGAGTEPGDDYIPGKTAASLEDLRPYLAEGTLTAREAEQSIVSCRKLDILPSSRSYHSAKAYPEDALRLLYDCFQEKYDYILIDGGSALPDRDLTAEALDECGMLFFIVTQQQKVLRRCIFRKNYLDRLSVPVNYVVNKYHEEKHFPSIRELRIQFQCEEKNMVKVGYVPYGWQAEMERETLLRYREFSRGIQAICEKICRTEPEKSKKGKLFRRG